MDDTAIRRFFTHPTQTFHRQYEALRAVIVDGRSQKEVAEAFGFEYGSFRLLVHEFRRSFDARRSSTHSPFFQAVERNRRAANREDRVVPAVADRQTLILCDQKPLHLKTRAAGVFLFVPLLARMGFDSLVRDAGYPGSKMVPADAALLSLLSLKLLRKERLSHIDDCNVDQGLGLFAGLNVLPKKSFATDYSYRTQRTQQEKLLGSWVKKLSPILLPEAKAFSLDFHPIPYRGEEALLENHYIPCRGLACPSVQAFFAQSATIDIPKRRNKRIHCLDEQVQLDGCEGALRQIAVTGLGREQPTLFLTNHPDASPRELITNYARRNGIEDGLGTNVNFFHMDNLSSEVRLNVDLDVTLTVIANSCYRWLAGTLKGFDHAKPKQLSRKFIETSGEIELLPNRIMRVTFDRRCHNPILREAALDKDSPPIPWLNGYRIAFKYR